MRQPCLIHVCTMQGSYTFHACNMHEMCVKFHACYMPCFYLKNVPNPGMSQDWNRKHACNMHGVNYYSVPHQFQTCMKVSVIWRMECAETCMKLACFRCYIFSRGGLRQYSIFWDISEIKRMRKTVCTRRSFLPSLSERLGMRLVRIQLQDNLFLHTYFCQQP